jgi:quercetin dioxygenase-like cupin family protein
MCCLVTIFVLTLPVSGVLAETMPEGVSMMVLKESAAKHLPGVAKTRLVELRLAPGAKWMNHTIADSGFCTALQGTITLEVGDKTVSRFAGDTWVMKKGKTVNVYNRGSVEHITRMWLLIEE